MPIKTLLVPNDGTETAAPALEMAFNIAQELEAHVDSLHMRPDAREAVPLLGEGMSGAMIEEMIDMAEAEAQKRATEARALFDAACTRHGASIIDETSPAEGFSASWIEGTGREDEAVAWRGRLADMMVVGRPTAEAEAPSTMTLNAALFETGRPVLVAPPEPIGKLGRKVAISWNGSIEASRAVAFAMPLISRAEEVAVLTADSDRTTASVATELARYLAWHGISAEMQTFLSVDKAVGETILKECETAGVDLLIMGAYTHSRMRQLILGGVTRHVLSESGLPLLMAH